MEIPEITEDVYSALHDIWDRTADKRPDGMRSPDILDYFLFQDGGATRLFVVGGTPAIVIFGDIEEGLSARVVIVNPHEAEPSQILRELRDVMLEWDLKRLTAEVPGPVKDVQQTLKAVGFRREGHLRRATFWNGRLCGIDVYGIYKDAPKRRPNGPSRTPERADRSSRSADSDDESNQSSPVGDAALAGSDSAGSEPHPELMPATEQLLSHSTPAT